jgi:hypothetical protein
VYKTLERCVGAELQHGLAVVALEALLVEVLAIWQWGSCQQRQGKLAWWYKASREGNVPA